MKMQQILCSICLIAFVLPMTASAEIYKWKDKNGVMRYSDTPPPPNVKASTIGKTGKDTAVRPRVEGEATELAPQAKEGEAEVMPVKLKDPTVDPELEAEREKARLAEIEKQKKLVEEKKAKADAENCKTAKQNYQSYLQGGRIYKIDEDGKRVYMNDNDIAAGKSKAQAEINKYCK